ncbi:MAG: adenosylcobinamide-GDP ribazoletransferase [Actinobacteria bacterium]|nr:adenosylcobinamide-GDP ribazoletransferase [Actinomycetota bacterium]
MQPFRLALSFLTIIPAGISQELDARAFGKSIKYFPVVGLIIGLVLIGLNAIIPAQLPGLAADMVLVIAVVIMTRSLHLDGLADTFDGLIGGRDKDHMLAIMKDSRVGSFGVVAIVAVIGLKLLLLSSVSAELKLGALISFPVLGRWSACYAMVTQSYAGSNGGIGASFMEEIGWRELLWSSVIALAITVLILKSFAILIVSIAWVFTILYTKVVNSKIGGMTGDTLGALIELTEVVVLFIVAVI